MMGPAGVGGFCSHRYGPWLWPHPPLQGSQLFGAYSFLADRHHSWGSFLQGEEMAARATAKAILQDPCSSMQAH